MSVDTQTLKVKENKENNHYIDASFGFNLNDSIDYEVYV